MGVPGLRARGNPFVVRASPECAMGTALVAFLRIAIERRRQEPMHRRQTLALAAALFATALVPALAQDAKWPSRNITYIVPFGAGGTTDVLARMVTPKVAAALGTTFVIENKPGAGGNMGSDFTAKSAPDGYTIQG